MDVRTYGGCMWISDTLNILLEDLRQAFNSEDEGPFLLDGLRGKKSDVTIRKRDKLLASSTEFDHDEEEKPKLKMQVSYKGLTVTDEALCIIIEPRASEPLDTASNLRQRTLEETIAQRQGSAALPLQREKTPLFLPDPDFERDSFSPFPIRRRSPPEVEEEREYESLQAFGETLNSMRDGVAGDIDDDDDDEGQVFLGDADERKGPV
ncbi:hypothetical protein Clacol_001623 [Clathrus columnatus]|uniref:Uncharacterized protein n=1 Tax=Clathrus columnatus TaxID=1419009 RepID=A0AAV5A326_9AGAM|nr:hypothetical protein Clacol_001623 [Clathrus columnatus]